MSDHPPLVPTTNRPAVDLVVVGGGPVGLFAAFYAGLRKLTVSVLDSHDVLGGQLAGFYPDDPIYDVPGHPAITASSLVDLLSAQADQAAPRLWLSELVHRLDTHPVGHAVVTDQAIHPARAVILAIGVGAIQTKQSTVAALCETKTNISCHLSAVLTQPVGRVCILGTDQRTRRTTLDLLSAGWQVSVCSPHELSASDYGSSVRLCPHYEPIVLLGSSRVESVRLRHVRQGTELDVPTDFVLVQVGLEMSLRPLLAWGLELHGNAIRVDSTMSTNRSGIYAAGDIASYPGKVKLIAVGFSEAATAVNHIAHLLDSTQKVFPGYSTSIASKRLPRFASNH